MLTVEQFNNFNANHELKSLLTEICGDRYATEWDNLNYKLIPVSVVKASKGNEIKFNRLHKLLLDSDFDAIKRTKSGGISIARSESLYSYNKYDVIHKKAFVEITLCCLWLTEDGRKETRSYRIQWRTNNYKEDGEEFLVSGRKSFLAFKKECEHCGIDLGDYEVSKEEGLACKSEIHKADIRLFEPYMNTGRILKNANHLDFHKFYFEGLMKSHHELERPIKEFVKKSKESKEYKTMMAATIGYMQSEYCGYRYAKLAKDAINRAYEDYDLVLKLLSEDRTLLATNTDGIWYQGEEWHGPLESPEVGGWSNDHVGCTIRFKSKGSYEYLENGEYHPVVRGSTELDKLKSRDQWVWGDVFNPLAEAEYWTFDEDAGVIWHSGYKSAE